MNEPDVKLERTSTIGVIITAHQQRCGKVLFQSCLSVCLGGPREPCPQHTGCSWSSHHKGTPLAMVPAPWNYRDATRHVQTCATLDFTIHGHSWTCSNLFGKRAVHIRLKCLLVSACVLDAPWLSELDINRILRKTINLFTKSLFGWDGLSHQSSTSWRKFLFTFLVSYGLNYCLQMH